MIEKRSPRRSLLVRDEQGREPDMDFDDVTSSLDEETTSRGSFLRKLLTFAAAGVGIAALPARARARPDVKAYCCPNFSCQGCEVPNRPFYCSGACGPCCICYPGTSCVSLYCPC